MFLLAVLVCSPMLAGQIEETIDTTPGALLEVDLETGGSLEIRGWSQSAVHVEAIPSGKDGEGQEIVIEKTSDGVLVETEFVGKRNRKSDRGYDVIINVPASYDLDVETMGGDITVSGVTGELEGETMGGDLTFSNVGGTLAFETMGGDIELRDSDVDGEVETMGGQVLVENVTGDVDGSSMGGNVIYKNVTRRDGAATGKAAVISTMGGDIELGNAPAGATVETMGGDIEIESAAQFVEAETMGGDITLGAVDGRVEASTMGGDVKVTIIGDPQVDDRDIELSSMGGDIHLSVPRNFSMEVEIEIAYGEKSKIPEIISDADLTIETHEGSGGFFNRQGNRLTASGSFNGGKNKVEIETVGGNVYLKYAK